MYSIIEFNQEKSQVKNFLALPDAIYDVGHRTQDKETERSLLEGNHPLNGYFKLRRFLVYEKDEVRARFALTIYPDDDSLYLGFYECVDDDFCAKTIFDYVDAFAKREGFKKIVGPLDASFWIKYRMKIDHFDDPYTLEPYNADYYPKQWRDNGFSVCEEYISNVYKRIPLVQKNKEKYKNRYEKFKSAGYKIISLNKKTFEKGMGEIYEMLMELYCDFPLFKAVSKKDFYQIFSSLKYIADFSIVKIAYFDNEPAGFFINLPDYGNLLHRKLTIAVKIQILLRKIWPKRYVSLYIGVRPEHHGLAKAMVQTVLKKFYFRRAIVIGALTKKERVTSKYLADMISDIDKYVLFEKGCDK